MIVKFKDKEYHFEGFIYPINEIQNLVDEAYQQGRENAIEVCAKVCSSLVGICKTSCPVDCNLGTDESCIESWKDYLAEQLKEQK